MSPKTQMGGHQTKITNCVSSGLGNRMRVLEELKEQVIIHNIITITMASDTWLLAGDAAFLGRAVPFGPTLNPS